MKKLILTFLLIVIIFSVEIFPGEIFNLKRFSLNLKCELQPNGRQKVQVDDWEPSMHSTDDGEDYYTISSGMNLSIEILYKINPYLEFGIGTKLMSERKPTTVQEGFYKMKPYYLKLLIFYEKGKIADNYIFAEFGISKFDADQRLVSRMLKDLYLRTRPVLISVENDAGEFLNLGIGLKGKNYFFEISLLRFTGKMPIVVDPTGPWGPDTIKKEKLSYRYVSGSLNFGVYFNFKKK